MIAHAIVMALAGATNTGDIDNWFPDKGETSVKSLDWFPDKGETSVKSLDYLPIMRRQLIEAKHLLIGNIDITIISGEQPRMKKRLPEMRDNIAKGLAISPDQVHIKVSSMDGQDEVAKLEGIEARVLISLWEDL